MGAGRLSYKRVLVFENSVLEWKNTTLKFRGILRQACQVVAASRAYVKAYFHVLLQGGLHPRALLASVDSVRCPVLS